MPTPAFLLTLAAVLPLGSFLMLVFLGKRMGNPLAGWVATAFIFMSLGLSLAGMIAWYNGGQLAGLSWGPGDKPIDLSIKWFPTGPGIEQDHPGFLDLEIYVDSLTIAMFNMVTLVALLAHVFSVGYIAEDKRFPRFFSALSLLCFSMLGLLLGGTLLQLLIFWELLGFSAYLLIGFRHERPDAAGAAFRMFIINRIGDMGLLVGVGIAFYLLGNISLLDMTRLLGAAGKLDGKLISSLVLSNGATVSATLLTIMGIAMFVGVIAKSAQFPLHFWLADAMEAPMPASALICSATMVAAGVYLLGRIFPILTPDAKLFIAIIGTITLTLGALIACVQSDLRKILAYSTVSQLGYIVLAMGIGSWVGGLFHLLTHAFFKSLLFLACGSVIRAAGKELPRLGGLMRKIPVTAATFGVGVLAIAGAPLFSGYYSTGMILSHAGATALLAIQNGHSHLYWLLFIVPTVVTYITAFYMMRCWMLTFWGTPRNQEIHAVAGERPALWFPLLILAGLSILGGSQLLDIKRIVREAQSETENYSNAVRAPGSPAFSGFSQSWNVDIEQRPAAGPDVEEPRPAGETPARLLDAGARLTHKYAFIAFAVGILAAFGIYARGYSIPSKLMRIAPLRVIHRWLLTGMHLDKIRLIFISPIIATSRFVARLECRLGNRKLTLSPSPGIPGEGSGTGDCPRPGRGGGFGVVHGSDSQGSPPP
jgi:proton-translocating NADH-quinone oxidoreductase chain L